MVATLIEQARDVLGELQLEEVDVTEHPDVAVKYRAMATPALAINGELAFVGVPAADALLARLRAARGETRL